MQIRNLTSIKADKVFSATRALASSIGVVAAGLAGMTHGLFAALQGNVAPGSAVINAIGPEQRIWPEATLHALTIIPNFLITGILAMIAGLLIVVWAGVFIDRKYGARILLLLSVVLLLVGGGFGPFLNGTIAGLCASQINKPLTWWRVHLPAGVRKVLITLWPWSLIAYLLVFLFSVEIAVFGFPLVWLKADTAYAVLLTMGPVSDVFLLGAIITVFSYDIQKPTDSSNAVGDDTTLR